jgi:hypothetical protein
MKSIHEKQYLNVESLFQERVKIFTEQIPNNTAYCDIPHNKGNNRKLKYDKIPSSSLYIAAGMNFYIILFLLLIPISYKYFLICDFMNFS